MAGLATFRIHLSPDPAKVKVEVNGQDISDAVNSITVNKPSQYEIPVVGLELLGEEIEITGDGLTFLARGGREVDEVLAGMNPHEIEAEALQRAPHGVSVTGAVLEVVREKIRALL